MPAHFGISGTSLGVPQGVGTQPGGGDPLPELSIL